MLTAKKNKLNLRENNQSVLCTRKMKNCDFCRRSFDHSLEVFRSKYLTKGTFLLKKISKFFFAHNKWKTQYFLEKFFSKSGSFPLKVENRKSIFSEKIYQIVLLRSLLAALTKQPQLFCPTFDKKKIRFQEHSSTPWMHF